MPLCKMFSVDYKCAAEFYGERTLTIGQCLAKLLTGKSKMAPFCPSCGSQQQLHGDDLVAVWLSGNAWSRSTRLTYAEPGRYWDV